MATVKILPTSYRRASSQLSISNGSNLYTDTSSDTYARITHTDTSSGVSSVYNFFIYGFETNKIPEGARVTNYSVKIKIGTTRGGTSHSTGIFLCYSTSSPVWNNNNYSAFSDTGILKSNDTFSLDTYTFPTDSISWSTLNQYIQDGSFGICVPVTSANPQGGGVDIYGTEIEVTYDPPKKYVSDTKLQYFWNKIKSYITNVVSGKQDVLTAGDNINISNNTISANFDIESMDIATKQYVDNHSTPVTASSITSALGYTPANPSSIPTNVSQLTNDSRYITTGDAQTEAAEIFAIEIAKPTFIATDSISKSVIQNAFNVDAPIIVPSDITSFSVLVNRLNPRTWFVWLNGTEVEFARLGVSLNSTNNAVTMYLRGRTSIAKGVMGVDSTWTITSNNDSINALIQAALAEYGDGDSATYGTTS